MHQAGWYSVSGENLPSSPYVIKDGKVYYYTGQEAIVVAGADAATFVSMSDTWGKDTKNVYYAGFKEIPANSNVPTVDTGSFSVVYGNIAKDKNVVYVSTFNSDLDTYTYQNLSGADAATLVLVDGFPYVKDKSSVYYIDHGNVQKILGINSDAFRVLGECANVGGGSEYYATDGHSIIASSYLLSEIDATSFAIIGSYNQSTYATDKNHVYKDCGQLVPSVSPLQCIASNLTGCQGN